MLFLPFPMQTYGLQKRSLSAEPLPTTKRLKLINKQEFAVAALDKEHETFMVHVAAILETTTVCPSFSKSSSCFAAR